MCLRKSIRGFSTSPLPAGIIELNEVRHDLLTVFGIWIHVLSGLEQREVFGAKFFLQFVYLLGQLSSFLAVFLLVGLVELITEIEDLAIGLGFSLIATDDADDLLCQFGSIGLLSLSKQRRRRNNQNPQDQQPVHKFPRDPQATIPQKILAMPRTGTAIAQNYGRLPTDSTLNQEWASNITDSGPTDSPPRYRSFPTPLRG